jgi:hypothetical protein
VLWRRGVELPDPSDPLRFVKELLGALNARLRLGMLWEPPGADPHAGWCGDWGANPPVTRLALGFKSCLSNLCLLYQPQPPDELVYVAWEDRDSEFHGTLRIECVIIL